MSKKDLNHRLFWKKPYGEKWLQNFTIFNKKADLKKLKVLVGISPGLSFDFKSFLKGNEKDLDHLVNKINNLRSCGAKYFCILFDDLPNNFNKKVPEISEGLAHAKLINAITKKLNIPIFVVPRIYSDELVSEDKNYLNDFFNVANDEVYFFYTGRYVVSENFDTKMRIIKKQRQNNKIIYWDNFYANDYCPKRLILGPWKNKNLIEKSMINGHSFSHVT